MDPRGVQPVAASERQPGRKGLLALCLVTALVCGAAVGMLAPHILIGETARKADTGEAVAAVHTAAGPLGLTERLGLDPREIEANQQRWAAMSEAERLAVVARYRRLAEMDAAERDQLLQKYQEFRQLSGDQQADLRRRAIRLAAFVQSLSPQDQALLESMADDQRAARLLELWRAREAA